MKQELDGASHKHKDSGYMIDNKLREPAEFQVPLNHLGGDNQENLELEILNGVSSLVRSLKSQKGA